MSVKNVITDFKIKQVQEKMKKFFDDLKPVFDEFNVVRVGNECICPIENAGEFIDRMTALGIEIGALAWWCHVCGGHEPCGLGGPRNKYSAIYSGVDWGSTDWSNFSGEEDWYSEICGADDCSVEFDTNEEAKRYVLYEWPKSPKYRPCFTPGFYIDENQEIR